MQRELWIRCALVAAVASTCSVAMAQSLSPPKQGTSAPTQSVQVPPPVNAVTPALAPAQQTPPGTAAAPVQPLTNSALPPLSGQVPGPPTSTGTGQPMTGAAAGQPLTSAQPITAMRTPARSDDAQTAFRALDPTNRGFVTRADTDKISGFLGFDNADADRDGRLTPEEFQNAWKFFAQ
jgi:hypothetical protein